MTDNSGNDFPLKAETYTIIGAAMEVHNTLGNGFLESVYQEALEYELEAAGIPYSREEKLTIKYKQHTLKTKFCPDFICYDSIIVELKALSDLTSAHESQLLNYLKATDKEVGLLCNFGRQRLQHKRIIASHYFYGNR